MHDLYLRHLHGKYLGADVAPPLGYRDCHVLYLAAQVFVALGDATQTWSISTYDIKDDLQFYQSLSLSE